MESSCSFAVMKAQFAIFSWGNPSNIISVFTLCGYRMSRGFDEKLRFYRAQIQHIKLTHRHLELWPRQVQVRATLANSSPYKANNVVSMAGPRHDRAIV